MEKHQLDWISIEGFKSIANSGKIELRPINLVIGANGSGKSNFIEFFTFIQAVFNKQLTSYVEEKGGADDLLFLGTKTTKKIATAFSASNGQTDIYSLELNLTDHNNLRQARETFTFLNAGRVEGSAARYHDDSKSIKRTDEQTPYLFGDDLKRRYNKIRRYHLHDTSAHSPLKKTNKTDDNDYLRADGSNLASFLYRLQVRFPNEYELIVKTVQRIAPFFEDFLLRPGNLNPEFIKLAWTHKGTDKYFGASAFSDGTLRFIALATLLLQPLELRPSVILIDEPELGLHPEAIGLLASLIKLASVDTQIIAATQSPTLLDHFLPEDVLVAERVNGGTVFNRLDSNRLQVWLEDYSLGQLWEKNEIGGNPLPENSK